MNDDDDDHDVYTYQVQFAAIDEEAEGAALDAFLDAGMGINCCDQQADGTWLLKCVHLADAEHFVSVWGGTLSPVDY